MNIPLLECVPNFSEGRDNAIIQQIADAIEGVPGVQLLDVDPGAAANRTVMTFVGPPHAVVEGAFQGIKTAGELIDMRKQTGEHPRMGATDVCPLIPIAKLEMDEVAKLAHQLSARVGNDLGIPVYCYEHAATIPLRKNLATIRAGEYEGLEQKMQDQAWKPDFGPTQFNAQSGATVIGARDFLIAYNINLNTKDIKLANAVAFDVREIGRVKRNSLGNIERDEQGKALRIPGKCKSLKAIGWFIAEYNCAQVSMNLTDIKQTNLHQAFDACVESATHRGLKVTGSELVGMIPVQVLKEAGHYFFKKHGLTIALSEEEMLKLAVKFLGLEELRPFDLNQKVIEFRMRQ